MKDLRVRVNFKEISRKDVEDPSNLIDTRIMSVIRTSRRSEGTMSMLGETTQAFGPIKYIISDHNELLKNVIGGIPISFHNKALKLTFPRDIRGLTGWFNW